eukprot:c20235_g1_i1 orf=207-1355(+)
MAEVQDAGGYYISVPSSCRVSVHNPAQLLSPRLALLNSETTPPECRLRPNRASNGEEYVHDVYEGSLVHYFPEERKVGKLEKRFSFAGFLPTFLGLRDFFCPEVWRAALSEFVATAILIFISTAGAISCLQAGFQSPLAAVGLIEFITLSFMILAAAPASGGHLNPAITLATMLTGFSTPVRALLYIIAQTAGSAVGGLILNLVVAEDVAAKFALGGCLLRNTIPVNGVLMEAGISTGAGLVAEFVFTLALLYISFSVALDPKQFQVTGPILAPFMVGAVIGLLIFMSGGLASVAGGYTGAGLNPARCFGPAVAIGGHLWRDQWVFWVGPLLSCVAFSILYHIIPPHHVELYRSRMDIFAQLRTLFSSNPSSSSERLVQTGE